MTTPPLFIADLDELKARLRLSGTQTDAGADIVSMIDDAIRDARVTFRRKMSQDAVETLVGYSSVDEPMTDEEIQRAAAELLEVKLVKVELLQKLRVFFLDNSAHAEDAMQHEGLLRDAQADDFWAMIRALKEEIENDFNLLLAPDELGEEVTVGVGVIEAEADCPNPRPGDSLWAYPDSGGQMMRTIG